ncbi:MAG TPA: assimilatory sulfite reductase (NADPH) flavoprotein subunit [Luteolibacter sp.]
MFPDHAPFTPDQRRLLEAAISGLDPVQRGWLSGFLASSAASVASAPAAPAAATKLVVLYGTESGNAESLADRAGKEAKKRGFQPVVKNMSEISAADLAKVSDLLVVVSTWGDGEPPESATAFYKELMAAELDLKHTRFTVCALGDTSYDKFCQTGKDVDARLETLGAKRVSPRQDCDVDYEENYSAWLDAALKAFAPQTAAPVVFAGAPAAVSSTVEYGKKNPFPSEVVEHVILNGEGSTKETLHVGLSLDGSGLVYEPGDALAVLPVNAPDVVEAVLKAAKLTGTESVEVKGEGSKLLADALREDFDITAVSRAVLTKLQATTGSTELAALLADDAKEQLKAWTYGREIVDAIETFAPNGLAAAQLTGILRKLPPRLYSIASSPLAHPGEVHLTVAAVRYESNGRQRKGVCSTYLADLVKEGSKTRVFVQPNKHFRLPASGETPVIMVGPGTGVAPFRAFVEHRAALGHPGKNWLFFGDQRYTYDFLYQLEWQDHLKSGVLSKLDVAFSRDQPEKIYVQQKMLEHAKELYAWLEEGAHFYVCGDASRMAHDVHETLLSIIEKQGNKSREAAEAYVEDLKKSHRYQRDVY